MKGVTIQQWRDFAYKTGITKHDAKAHTKWTSFNRASDALQVAGKIGIWEGHVWPAYEQKEN